MPKNHELHIKIEADSDYMAATVGRRIRNFCLDGLCDDANGPCYLPIKVIKGDINEERLDAMLKGNPLPKRPRNVTIHKRLVVLYNPVEDFVEQFSQMELPSQVNLKMKLDPEFDKNDAKANAHTS